MRDELERVAGLTRTSFRAWTSTAWMRRVLGAFDARPGWWTLPPRGLRVQGRDDQKFIDLAAAHRAILLSKDKAVICMRKRL